MSRAILFDLDGTLVDSHADLAHAVNAALTEVGLAERSIAEITSFIGEGSRRLIEKSVGDRQDLFEPAHAAWERAYTANLLVRTRLYPGVAELLERLAQSDPGKLAVHTNKPGRFARPILEGLGVMGRFARVLGGGDGKPRKPSPDGARWLLAELGAAPEESIYVGDSNIDGQTAAAAGLRFIGVAWGYGVSNSCARRARQGLLGTWPIYRATLYEARSCVNCGPVRTPERSWKVTTRARPTPGQ